MTVDRGNVSEWIDEYLDAFAACGRREKDTASLLVYYGVPLLLTTDRGLFALTTGDQVVAAIEQEFDGMRAADYARTELVDSDITVLNRASALHRGTFSRRRSDGGETGRVTSTYLLTDGVAGRRISAIAIHSS